MREREKEDTRVSQLDGLSLRTENKWTVLIKKIHPRRMI